MVGLGLAPNLISLSVGKLAVPRGCGFNFPTCRSNLCKLCFCRAVFWGLRADSGGGRVDSGRLLGNAADGRGSGRPGPARAGGRAAGREYNVVACAPEGVV